MWLSTGKFPKWESGSKGAIPRAILFCRLWRNHCLLSDLAGAEGFSARMAKAHQADDGDDEKAGLDEELAAVGPIDGGIFQGGGGGEGVPRERAGGGINGKRGGLSKGGGAKGWPGGNDGH